MHLMNVAKLLVVACALATSACELFPLACTADAKPAVSVTVHDSVTNVLAGRGARIIARDGAFADTAAFTNYDGPYGLAHERTGSYDVTVEQQGYRVWSRAGLKVTDRDECHVRTVSITARLQL